MDSEQRSDVTILLWKARAGDREAASVLIDCIYPELKRIARRAHQRSKDNQLQPTAVVHEAYLRLMRQEERNWESRAFFFAAAAQTMRRVICDQARAGQAQRRGGGAEVIELNDEITLSAETPKAILALDSALADLEKISPRQARIVELRYFTGLTVEETAVALEMSPRAVDRDWAVARAWLRRAMTT